LFIADILRAPYCTVLYCTVRPSFAFVQPCVSFSFSPPGSAATQCPSVIPTPSRASVSAFPWASHCLECLLLLLLLRVTISHPSPAVPFATSERSDLTRTAQIAPRAISNYGHGFIMHCITNNIHQNIHLHLLPTFLIFPLWRISLPCGVMTACRQVCATFADRCPLVQGCVDYWTAARTTPTSKAFHDRRFFSNLIWCGHRLFTFGLLSRSSR
jgi:hypothetical protein